MAGLLNRRIRFVDADGAPRVLGFHAVGDAHTCTNPLYGRGCSLAMVQATLLADALTAHPDDPEARGRQYEERSATEVEPWYKAAVAQDRMAREEARRQLAAADGTREPVDGTGDGSTGTDAADAGTADSSDTSDSSGTSEPASSPFPPEMLRDLMRDGLFPAVRTRAVVYRAFLRGFNLLAPPDALLADPVITAEVLQCYQERDTRPPEEPLGPPRDEMLAALV